LQEIVPEQNEEEVSLPVMTRGREVVEDYPSHGLSLRPIRSLSLEAGLPLGGLFHARAQYRERRLTRYHIWCGSAPVRPKGVMFITLEDETSIVNLIIWPSLFDKQRRVIFGAQTLAWQGKVQAANAAFHVVAQH
jgi:error-prone DNA polymerase